MIQKVGIGGEEVFEKVDVKRRGFRKLTDGYERKIDFIGIRSSHHQDAQHLQ